MMYRKTAMCLLGDSCVVPMQLGQNLPLNAEDCCGGPQIVQSTESKGLGGVPLPKRRIYNFQNLHALSQGPI